MLVRKLKMTAFGPYAGETEIDFSLLGDSGIYIITGETGAGKTTVFDGISFALFGEASGRTREAKSLRSKYAESDVKTSVSLDFSYRGKEYKIVRSPEYMRQSKRGNKFVKESANAEFYYPDGKVISGIKETDRAVIELIGMGKEQFDRVAMIAQGDFLKLLLAGTEERIKIFRNIFGTEKFDILQKRIAEDFNACQAELTKTANAFSAFVKEAETDGKDLSLLSDIEAAEYLNGLLEEDRRKYREIAESEEGLSKKIAELSKEAGILEKYKEDEFLLKKERENLVNLIKNHEEAKADEESAQEKFALANAKKTAVEGEAEKLELYETREKFVEKELVLQKNIVDCQRQKSINSDKKTKISTKIDEYKSAIAARMTCGAQAEKLKAEADKLEESLRSLNELLYNLKNLSYLEEEEKNLNALLKEKISKYDALSDKYKAAHMSYLKNISGTLADELKEGEPCPVCGSTSHPNPSKTKGERISEKLLESLKAESESAEKEASECGKLYSAKQAEIKAKRENLVFAAEKLRCALNEGEISLSVQQKNTDKNNVEKSLLRAKKGEEERKTYEKWRETYEKELENIRKEDEKISSDLEGLTAEKASLDGKKSAFSSLKYPSLDVLNEEKTRAQKEAEYVEKTHKRAKERRETAAKKLSESEGKIQTLQKTAALFSEEKYLKIEGELNNSQTKLKALKDKKEEIKERGTTNKNALKHVNGCIAEKEKQTARYNMLYPLYATAGGNVSGKEKVRLETFVQMQYFDRVLLRANARLTKMTDGQYELIRRETAADKRSQAGLDLDVIDHANGTRREASTLSGGESFLASLSLALGLSDEIQSGYGGIRIDSMFIDEGFGSLSSDALDGATETLAALSDGKLSIGIISHVEKLKERIDKQIVIKKCRLGSEAEVKIP